MSRHSTAEFRRNRERLIFTEGRPCAQCGSTDTDRLQADHIKSVAEGGTDSYENLQVLCNDCHKKKTAKQVNGLGYEVAQRIRAIKSGAGLKWWIYGRKPK